MATVRINALGVVGRGSCNTAPGEPTPPSASPTPPPSAASQQSMIPIDMEAWGLHGPAQTRWVEWWVYWVLPLGTLLLAFLAISTCKYYVGGGGSSSQRVVAPAVAVSSTSQPRRTSVRPTTITPAVTQPPPVVVTQTQTVNVTPKKEVEAEAPSLPEPPRQPSSIWDPPSSPR